MGQIHGMYAVPGGLIGVGTMIDPTLSRADRMVGQVLGSINALPEIFTTGNLVLFAAAPARRANGGRQEGSQSAEAVEERSVDGEHRFAVDRRPRPGRQG